MHQHAEKSRQTTTISRANAQHVDKAAGSQLASLSPPAFQFKSSNAPQARSILQKKDHELPKHLQSSKGNPEAAKQALNQLKAMQAADKKKRLSNPLINLLVWGVATPMHEGSDAGKEGIIGIHHAVNAAEALIGMDGTAYSKIIVNVFKSFGSDLLSDFLSIFSKARKKKNTDNWKVESVLLLKAVAARKSQYLAKKSSAGKEVDKFAGDIRGMDETELKKMTSLRDHGDGQGLQQKYTMSCGPTSIQIVYGEADPVFALDVSKTAKKNLEYDNDVGKQQKELLNKASAIPRKVKDRWTSFQSTINGLTISPTDLPKWQALLNYISGNPFDATKKAEGLALANGLGYTAAELTLFQQHFPFSEPGMSVADFQTATNKAKLDEVTNSSHGLNQFDSATNKVSDTDLDTLWGELFKGRDIPMGVFWSGGGGHYMVFTQAKGTPPKGGSSRKFLLSDPWSGKSEWLSADDVKNGSFGSFGSGYIDDIYW